MPPRSISRQQYPYRPLRELPTARDLESNPVGPGSIGSTMATAAMGLRRRVTVNNSPTPTGQQNPASSSTSTSTNVSNKRSRAENNNSPSHGNLNPLSTVRDEPPIKKSRGTAAGSSVKGRANSPAVTESPIERNHGQQTSGKGRNVSGGKMNRTKSPSISTITTANNTNVSSISSITSTNISNGQQVQGEIPSSGFNVLASTGWPAPASIPDAAAYTPMTGLNMTGSGQPSLCATGTLTLPPSIPYMATSMATFVGNATNLSKNSAVSYLDISNMTGGGSLNSNLSSSLGSSYPCKSTAVNSAQEPNGNSVPPPFSGVVPVNGGSSCAYGGKPSAQPSQNNPADTTVLSTVKTFQNDSMFNAYQPWVIKTYGDLAKTKTITIKKYARILRTLKGEEVNSAENSKFRFWVKSKGFHIGQPAGYDAKPADRIVGRHAVSSPGLDPPLYVPTQLPHNKALNGAEGTVPPGRVYKKVAIVENFFDIIHAVHVDLEGRPGKHAGQKRTYRTITETYAFLPREAVTRFLLGCTECQRRPRTPSPSNLSNQSQAPSVSSVSVGVAVTAGTVTSTTAPTTTTPLSPTPAATALSAPQPVQSSPNPREASHPPESKSLFSYRHPKHQQRSNSASVGTPKSDKDRDKDKERFDKEREKGDKDREEKYNPLSITNLLKKEPASGYTGSTTTTSTTITVNDSLTESRRTPESDRASSRSSASSKRKRMLPEGRTPSPPPTLPLPTPWSPGLDTTNTPIDYSLPITTTYLKHQQRIQAQQNKVAAAAAAAAQQERERASPTVIMMEEIERDRFSPAAGLIDTNLNLLATIQHLHCQVMVALTERLRPSVLPASLMLPPASGIFPNILIANEYSMPMARHHL